MLCAQGGSWRDVFVGASQAFFSFIGFDALATTAEEMIDPPRDMPRGKGWCGRGIFALKGVESVPAASNLVG